MTIDKTPPDIAWRLADGNPLACVEKLRVLRQNMAELHQQCQDALEDAILMQCDEEQFRRALHDLIDRLENPYKS